jgi:hypothetical protein
MIHLVDSETKHADVQMHNALILCISFRQHAVT